MNKQQIDNTLLEKQIQEEFPNVDIKTACFGLIPEAWIHGAIDFPYDLRRQEGSKDVIYHFNALKHITHDASGEKLEEPVEQWDVFWGIEFLEDISWELFLRGTNPLTQAKRFLLFESISTKNPPLIFNLETNKMEYNQNFVTGQKPELKGKYKEELPEPQLVSKDEQADK